MLQNICAQLIRGKAKIWKIKITKLNKRQPTENPPEKRVLLRLWNTDPFLSSFELPSGISNNLPQTVDMLQTY